MVITLIASCTYDMSLGPSQDCVDWGCPLSESQRLDDLEEGFSTCSAPELLGEEAKIAKSGNLIYSPRAWKYAQLVQVTMKRQCFLVLDHEFFRLGPGRMKVKDQIAILMVL